MRSNVEFARINLAYQKIFQPNKLTIGLVVPITSYQDAKEIDFKSQLVTIQLVEQLGFSAVWLRDIPFHVPNFGDDGQVFDPFVYLGMLSAITKNITLGIASLILPLRHPIHIAKAAASIDVLSNGRFLLGIASGDRQEEYPAMNKDYGLRGHNFRDSVEYLRQMWQPKPSIDNSFGFVDNESTGLNLYPKPTANQIPLLITGASQQSTEWAANNTDGLITYARYPSEQRKVIKQWNDSQNTTYSKPVMQPLYIDIEINPNAPIVAIPYGVRGGINSITTYLKALEEVGINHVCLNLRFNKLDTTKTLKLLADKLLPEFTV